MKLKPVGERALVRPEEREEKTESGIVLPDTAKERPQTAEIIAAGDGEEVKVKKGDTIVFASMPMPMAPAIFTTGRIGPVLSLSGSGRTPISTSSVSAPAPPTTEGIAVPITKLPIPPTGLRRR